MRFLFRLIFFLFLNYAALFIAGVFIPGFEISSDPINLLIAAAVFTLINFYVRPLIKLILSPIIILTLGLFSFVINMGMLRLLDILNESVIITGIKPLVYGTILITIVNFFVNFFSKYVFRQGKLI